MSRTRLGRAVAAALAALLVPLGAGVASAQAGTGAGGYAHHHHGHDHGHDHGGSRHHYPTTWDVLAGNESANHSIQSMKFLPGTITINAGDKVRWLGNSYEPHTVTFFKGGTERSKLPTFDPSKAWMVKRIGGDIYNSNRLFSSGILNSVPQGQDFGPFVPGTKHYASYTLKFVHTGTFVYYCLVHGKLMMGKVKVQPAGSAYPLSPAAVKAAADTEAHALIVEGRALRRQARAHSSNHMVVAGADNMDVMLMRFVPRTVRVHVGDTVTWKTMGFGPHTVTFGQEPMGPALFRPSGNPKAYAGGNLNSGILGGKPFSVTFTKAGRYPYICGLHDFMGMHGKVIVLGGHHHR